MKKWNLLNQSDIQLEIDIKTPILLTVLKVIFVMTILILLQDILAHAKNCVIYSSRNSALYLYRVHYLFKKGALCSCEQPVFRDLCRRPDASPVQNRV